MALTCLQIREVIQWSARNFGGAEPIDLNRAEFVDRVVDSLFDKLDPRHVLFLKSEIENFQVAHLDAWKSLMNKGDCSSYEQRIVTQYSVARLRFFKMAKTLPIDSIAPVKRIFFTGFSKNEPELKNRIRQYVSFVLDESTPAVLRAYRGNRRVYVEDNFQQIIAEESDGLARTPRLLLVKAALGAMDSYSTYFSDSEFLDFHEDLSAGTTGIGVRLRKVPTGLLVESLVAGAPAQRSGLVKVGDTITAINKEPVAALAFGESRKLFRGTPNSSLSLTLARSSSEVIVVELKRAPFAFEDGKVRFSRGKNDSSVLIVDLPSFYSNDGMKDGTSSYSDLRSQLVAELVKQTRPKALVLDVRGNPGGYLEEAVQMAGLFIGERPVVGVVSPQGKQTLRDIGASQIFSGPIVVLQNEESASAAEILTGALRDYERAVVVGTPSSYGKGSVQRLFDLDGSIQMPIMLPGVVKLTTSLFFTPLGHNPNNGGIRSDIPISQGRSNVMISHRVRDLRPIVDASLLSRIQKERRRMDVVRAALKVRSLSRANPLADNSSHFELNEAVQVASDWLAFERAESNGMRYQTHRDVIGY